MSCPAGGWSAFGLVPEWELIIRFDEETHVPVMSEPARLQVTSTLFGKSIPQQYHKRPQLIFVTHVITCSSHFSHCVVVQWSNIPPKDAGNEAFCLLKWCDSFPCMTGQRGAIRKSIACPHLSISGLSFQGPQRLSDGVKFAKEKGSIVAYEYVLKGKNIAVGSTMTQAEFYIGIFAPPPSSCGSDIVPQTSAAG